jgi:hypothetical protein
VESEPYVGLLRNNPQLAGVIEFGARVPFGPEHVAAYAYSSDELGYDVDGRCFLLKRVAEADDPPPLLVRTEDGDWEAHATDESEEELEDVENVLRWTLGYLTSRFPQTTDALREGSDRRDEAWWEWRDGRYVGRGARDGS